MTDMRTPDAVERELVAVFARRVGDVDFQPSIDRAADVIDVGPRRRPPTALIAAAVMLLLAGAATAVGVQWRRHSSAPPAISQSPPAPSFPSPSTSEAKTCVAPWAAAISTGTYRVDHFINEVLAVGADGSVLVAQTNSFFNSPTEIALFDTAGRGTTITTLPAGDWPAGSVGANYVVFGVYHAQAIGVNEIYAWDRHAQGTPRLLVRMTTSEAAGGLDYFSPTVSGDTAYWAETNLQTNKSKVWHRSLTGSAVGSRNLSLTTGDLLVPVSAGVVVSGPTGLRGVDVAVPAAVTSASRGLGDPGSFVSDGTTVRWILQKTLYTWRVGQSEPVRSAVPGGDRTVGGPFTTHSGADTKIWDLRTGAHAALPGGARLVGYSAGAAVFEIGTDKESKVDVSRVSLTQLPKVHC